MDHLATEIESYAADPLGFVQDAYSWGEGALTHHAGPRKWQAAILKQMGEHLSDPAKRYTPLRIAVASGHGIGKSALVGMVTSWGMSTCAETRMVVTANTEGQLRTKTWPEISKWVRSATNADWWSVPAMSMYEKSHEKAWRADAIPWSVNNTEGFAGLHNEGKRIILIYDEASGIDDLLWEVSEGALTDARTEIIWLAFGNPTKNTGRFRECFGSHKHLWLTHQIDSRTVEGTNREYIEEMVRTYGENSDYVKVRVRGIFPNSSSTQFIGRDLVDAAMERQAQTTKWAGRTAAVGVDVARFGDDESVIATRIGRDAQSIPLKRFRGLDTMQVASRVAEHVNDMRLLGLRVVLFVDGGGVGGGVIDRLRQLNFDPIEVQFGSKADDERKYANKRAEIWGRLKAWLAIGHIPKDEALATDLTSVEYGFTVGDQILLESKKAMKVRGLSSPDAGDAYAVTFAQDVPEFVETDAARSNPKREYDPFSITT
jgi:hypothetical protein